MASPPPIVFSPRKARREEQKVTYSEVAQSSASKKNLGVDVKGTTKPEIKENTQNGEEGSQVFGKKRSKRSY